MIRGAGEQRQDPRGGDPNAPITGPDVQISGHFVPTASGEYDLGADSIYDDSVYGPTLILENRLEIYTYKAYR